MIWILPPGNSSYLPYGAGIIAVREGVRQQGGGPNVQPIFLRFQEDFPADNSLPALTIFLNLSLDEGTKGGPIEAGALYTMGFSSSSDPVFTWFFSEVETVGKTEKNTISCSGRYDDGNGMAFPEKISYNSIKFAFDTLASTADLTSANALYGNTMATIVISISEAIRLEEVRLGIQRTLLGQGKLVSKRSGNVNFYEPYAETIKNWTKLGKQVGLINTFNILPERCALSMVEAWLIKDDLSAKAADGPPNDQALQIAITALATNRALLANAFDRNNYLSGLGFEVAPILTPLVKALQSDLASVGDFAQIELAKIPEQLAYNVQDIAPNAAQASFDLLDKIPRQFKSRDRRNPTDIDRRIRLATTYFKVISDNPAPDLSPKNAINFAWQCADLTVLVLEIWTTVESKDSTRDNRSNYWMAVSLASRAASCVSQVAWLLSRQAVFELVLLQSSLMSRKAADLARIKQEYTDKEAVAKKILTDLRSANREEAMSTGGGQAPKPLNVILRATENSLKEVCSMIVDLNKRTSEVAGQGQKLKQKEEKASKQKKAAGKGTTATGKTKKAEEKPPKPKEPSLPSPNPSGDAPPLNREQLAGMVTDLAPRIKSALLAGNGFRSWFRTEILIAAQAKKLKGETLVEYPLVETSSYLEILLRAPSFFYGLEIVVETYPADPYIAGPIVRAITDKVSKIKQFYALRMEASSLVFTRWVLVLAYTQPAKAELRRLAGEMEGTFLSEKEEIACLIIEVY